MCKLRPTESKDLQKRFIFRHKNIHACPQSSAGSVSFNRFERSDHIFPYRLTLEAWSWKSVPSPWGKYICFMKHLATSAIWKTNACLGGSARHKYMHITSWTQVFPIEFMSIFPGRNLASVTQFGGCIGLLWNFTCAWGSLVHSCTPVHENWDLAKWIQGSFLDLPFSY